MRHQQKELLLFIAAGFFFLLVDVFIGHAGAHLPRLFMWVPLMFLPCAVLVSIVTAFQATPFNQKIFFFTCLAALLLGVLGFYFHLSRILNDLSGQIQWEVLLRMMRYPPVFAPLGVSGIGILGILIYSSNHRKE